MAEVERRQCTARSKRTGNRCQRPPRVGATVCHQHGGASRHVQRVAARRLAEAKAAKSLAEHGVEAIGDPAAALLEVAEHAVASYKWLATYAAEVQGGAADTGELLARVQAMGRQQERAARVLAEIQRLGLAERRVEITAQQVALMQQLTAAHATRLVHLGGVAKESEHTEQRIDALVAEAERLKVLADEAAAEAARQRLGATQSYRDSLAARRQRVIHELPDLRAAVTDALKRVDEYTAEIAELDQADPTLDKDPERWGRASSLWQGRKIPATEADALAAVKK